MAPTPIILDASALLAVLQDEPGQEKVEPFLSRACISAVNLAEVATKLADRGVAWPDIEVTLRGLNLDVQGFDVDQALGSAALRGMTRTKGLSLGDRACLALTRKLGGIALTADRAWAGLARVELIR